jgi:hypothetical protein
MNHHTLMLLLYVLLPLQVLALDTEYSNEQLGVRLRILNLDGQRPLLRVENRSGNELAIRSPSGLAVSFFRGEERLTYKWEGYLSEHVLMPGDLVCIVPNGGNLEVPMADLYFNISDPVGYGRREPWVAGLKRMPAGSYQARITTNGGGMTLLETGQRFPANFDFPPLMITTP